MFVRRQPSPGAAAAAAFAAAMPQRKSAATARVAGAGIAAPADRAGRPALGVCARERKRQVRVADGACGPAAGPRHCLE